MICVLYNCLSNITFYCHNCRQLLGIASVPVRASTIPSTECDRFINNFLKLQHINLDDRLTIRLLSDMENTVTVKPRVLNFRSNSECVYRNCTLFAFFDTGLNTDICFFSVFYQLYGNQCPASNRNTAYISYIDSINLLPSTNRTKIYRLILLGLFEYLKSKGIRTVFLWSCPPKPSQDYIFYMKPMKMKMPTKYRLSAWYVDLFKLGIDLEVIKSYQGIQEYAITQKWKDIGCVPFMDGDVWLERIEQAIASVEKEAKKLRLEFEALRKRLRNPNANGKKDDIKKRLENKLNERWNLDKNQKLWNLISKHLKGIRPDYFVIELLGEPYQANQNTLNHCSIEREWINNRQYLESFFWENVLDFSDERRSQYSTFIMLFRIFIESRICVNCSQTSPAVNVSKSK